MPRQELEPAVDPLRVHEERPSASAPVLLDGGGPDTWDDGRARYACNPIATLEIRKSGCGLWRTSDGTRVERGASLEIWQRFLDSASALAPDPAAAWVVTVLSYDLKHEIERLPRRHRSTAEPLLWSALYDWRYEYDRRNERGSLRGAAGRRMRPLPEPAPGAHHGRTPRTDPPAYRAMLHRALEYIAAGDIYQVNLAQPFCISAGGVSGIQVFRALRDLYPTPFAAHLRVGPWEIVSASPECFLSVRGRAVTTHPIKGTRRRSADAPDLRSDPKEMAEHVMIVDLERNDLGRVCETGSVHVSELARVRAFPLLEHLVSCVRGTLRDDVRWSDLIAATFPGGSITGAPKVRAMQIIEELEPTARGVYTGAIGWTDLAGNGCFNLAIRTAVRRGDAFLYHAGGGIVADSDIDREHAESLLKAEAFQRAVRAAAAATTRLPEDPQPARA